MLDLKTEIVEFLWFAALDFGMVSVFDCKTALLENLVSKYLRHQQSWEFLWHLQDEVSMSADLFADLFVETFFV